MSKKLSIVLRKAVAVAGLMAVGLAQASPVLSAASPFTFGKGGIQVTEVVTDDFAFHLDQSATVQGTVSTLGFKTYLPAIDISDAYLWNASSEQRVSFLETLGADWTNAANAFEQWTLTPVLLSAGDWQMVVVEQGLGSKRESAYQGTLTAVSYNAPLHVPEPAGMLLSLTAVGAMGIALRRRRAA
ncbi:PEP-CTERM sorting domain-containing protein [Roseateles koreensis]|uniref:PEP-CTERM sorting domain-containing protein n=1 Tax=Roseateles koreensis TaxID=2987526 RepID=A0ABT5KU44_9BURK|nr:PEP-CTERM sorting domain-containing protein [Roseateles koreensis]MDC8785873.1 PEP-CTERM sorting domain-containing protein [Roseateles koreensis]